LLWNWPGCYDAYMFFMCRRDAGRRVALEYRQLMVRSVMWVKMRDRRGKSPDVPVGFADRVAVVRLTRRVLDSGESNELRSEERGASESIAAVVWPCCSCGVRRARVPHYDP